MSIFIVIGIILNNIHQIFHIKWQVALWDFLYIKWGLKNLNCL